ncbi:DNA methyltransferase [Pseudomonas sp. PS01299]|uniref:class I SAM-dependent DNA methyltransferase n=1 Tax=Pseudomonas sp. PS01299 TaxID=2991435 RepID=UPI00249BB54F|nr:DNA methyltransferase [Pseudomonas sp. PS01299]
MSINQTELYDALQALTQREDVRAEFIYGLLNAYGFAKSTITQLRNGGARNVAKITDDVALKGQLYFHLAQAGESVHEAAEGFKADDIIKRQKIRFVIVTDFKELVAYDLKADERLETPFTELHQQYSFFLPLAGLEKSYTHSESVADVKAAEKMGRLFDLIRERNQITAVEEVHALNVFLTRLLFCFFAEDTGIFKKHQFTDAIKSTTHENGEDVAEFLGKLFSVMNSPDDGALRQSMPAHLKAFPYVNGGLFAQQVLIPAFGAKSRRLLLECGTLDWSQINPDIFGSMFQAVIDEEQRSTMGQHYTSVGSIMKVIKPLFLDKLYAELERSRSSENKLKDLLERLACIKIFDPACGSGNFLIIAYKELRRFEMEVFRALNESSQQRVIFMTGIKLSQFYGIEIDDFAHEIALLSLWLAEHQMHQEFTFAFGHAEPMLPLKASGNIALGNSLRLDWGAVCPKTPEDEVYLIGNPPFLGTTGRSEEQSADMKQVFSGFKSLGYLDFVACWFWKGAQYIENSRAELALVSTNSICQGEQVATLWPSIFDLGLRIHIAYQSFPWSNNAKENAGVHVAIIGLSLKPEKKVIFNRVGEDWHSRVVSNISPYLIEGSNLVVHKRKVPILPAAPMYFGNKPTDGGNLMFTRAERDDLIAKEPAAERWIRKILGADEFINGKERFCLWLVDATADDIKAMPEVYRRTQAIAELRIKAGHAAALLYAKTPHLFMQISQPKTGSYILVPAFTSERRKYVPMGLISCDVIANNKNYIIPGGTTYELGILSSLMHMDWMRTVCGRLESRYGYSSGVVYNSFPWPDVTEQQRKQIEALAEEMLMIREDYPGKSLADLYDPETMPEPLKEAHKVLDAAVDRLYRTRSFHDASERLEYLFGRYEMLIEQERQLQVAQAVTKKTRKPRASKTAA